MGRHVMMKGIWPAKAGEATVAWRDECSDCGHLVIDHCKTADDLDDYVACIECDGIECARVDM